MKKAGLFLLFLFLIATVSHAQYIISGKVTDEQHMPLQGVSVTTGGELTRAITDSSGNYSFPFTSAFIYLTYSHIGYLSTTILIKGNVPDVMLYRNNNFLAETIVASFERNATVKNIPASVAVLNNAAMERYSGASFVPAINTVPGVKMDERSPGSYRLNIRGNLLRSTFGVRNVKVYWNGIPFTDANGNTYFNELALNDVDKIEILKGPSGSMYGSGTGGVVLLRSNFSAVKEKRFTLQTMMGSYGMFAADAAYIQSDKKSTTAFSYTHLQSDGYRIHSNMRRDAANFTGRYQLNEKQKINVNVFYCDLFYQTPGALTYAELSLNPRQSRPATGIFKSAEAQKAALYLKTIYAGVANEYRFNDKWNNTTSLYLSGTTFKNPTIRNYEEKKESGIGFRSLTQYKDDFFTGTFGAEYQYGFTNTSTFGNKLGIADTLQYHDEIASRQYNVFLQTDFRLLENLVLNAGISYNNFYYGFTRVNEIPVIAERSDFTPSVIPRVSLLTKIGKKLSIYGAISKGYSHPSIDEVHAGDGNFNKQLKPETAVNYEAGIKGDLLKNKLWIDASFYIFQLHNTIVSRRDSGGGDYFVNAGKTRQRGMELMLAYMPVNNTDQRLRQLKLWMSYTNVEARFINYQQGAFKYNGNKLTGTAPNILVAGADINTSPGFYANLTYSYTDKIPLNDANVFFAKPYNLFFCKAGFVTRFHKNYTADLFMVYDRSFNAPYSLGNDLNASGNRYYNASSPQNLHAGVRIKLIL